MGRKRIPNVGREELQSVLHQPTGLADIFGGYLCSGGSSWLTDGCACDESTSREQLEALASFLEANEIATVTS